jgi:tRNA G18 (ribose-2'-O)-methylase SpoU
LKKLTAKELDRPAIEDYVAAVKMPVAVVLDNVRSMNNVGSFFRTCDAFAAERLVLCGITAAPPNREIHKTALGAEQSVAWAHCPDTVAALAALRAEGYTLVAVEQVEGALSPEQVEWDPAGKYAVIFGNELSGVGQQAVDMCDMAVEIPQVGTKHSLNVAVSGGIVLWQIFSSLRV